MTSGDTGLQVIFGEFLAGSGLAQMKHTAGDQRLVPTRPVLLLEAQDVPLGVHSRRQSRRVQQHERDQRMRAGLIAGRMLGQQCRQVYCFPAKLFPGEVFAARRFVTFVEQQVESLLDAVETDR